MNNLTAEERKIYSVGKRSTSTVIFEVECPNHAVAEVLWSDLNRVLYAQPNILVLLKDSAVSIELETRRPNKNYLVRTKLHLKENDND